MGRLQSFLDMVQEKRIGFSMDEIMSGTHVFEPGMGPTGTLPFEFRVTWGPKHLLRWANPLSGEFMKQPLNGTVTAAGLCENARVTGTLELNYFTEGKLRYTFEFIANGKAYRFVGEKVNIRPWNLPFSHTTCFGVLVEKESGKLVSRSVTHFRMHTTPAFLLSLKFA
ncbi:MAG: hypothetical protein AB1921_15740 [Thermodesulfobacteriota bacterium]